MPNFSSLDGSEVTRLIRSGLLGKINYLNADTADPLKGRRERVETCSKYCCKILEIIHKKSASTA